MQELLLEVTVDATLEALGPQVRQLGHRVHSSPAGKARLSHVWETGLKWDGPGWPSLCYIRLRLCVFLCTGETRAGPGKRWDKGIDTEAKACSMTHVS